MSIATSIEKLSETLTNCKTNLKEKKVENVDNIKIGDVDEKIAEIQAGGGSSNEVDLSKIDFKYSNWCIIVWPQIEYDGQSDTFTAITGSPVLEHTFKNNGNYVYVAIFQKSDQKIEIKLEESSDSGEYYYYYSGLIDISTPKVFVVTNFNETQGQEPKT